MTTARIMAEVFDLLAEGRVIRAQERVLEAETAPITKRDPCPPRLPRSCVERVLRASVAANQLTQEYELWCKRVYGPRAWALVSAELGIDPHG